MTAVEWRMIPGFGGAYEVSNMGDVRSWLSRGGGRVAVPITLHPHADKGGYLRITLRDVQRSYHAHRVHRLVLLAFVGPPLPGQEAMHLNGNPSDNRLENLAWGTSKENQAAKKLHGTNCEGERHRLAKLCDESVRAIHAAHAEGVTLSALARRYGVSNMTIWQVISGRTWKHVEEAQEAL